GHCVLAATYLINKMPMEAIVTLPHRDKLEPRGLKYVPLGYPPNSKGYTLYDLNTKQVFHRRDVTFEEKVFPFKAQLVSSSDNAINTNSDATPEYNMPEVSISTKEVVEPVHTRRSTRNSNKPSWLKDFVLAKGQPSSANNVSTNTQTKHPKYPLFTEDDFIDIYDQHIAFLANVFAETEPSSYNHASRYPEWLQVMQTELKTLEKNHTWELTSLPPGHKAISSKWVFKTKYKADGTIDRYKERVLIALATAKGWLLQKDGYCINWTLTMLLHGFIDEDIYMQPPTGYTTASPRQGTHLNQRKYILDLLHDVGLTATKPVASLMPTNLKLSLGKRNPLSNLEAYRRSIGRLLYLTMTWPDISYVVHHPSQFVFAPTNLHMQAGLHLLKYLKGTISKGLFYLVHSVVSWKTKKQLVVSRSSIEAKYRVMAFTTFEILWLSFLLKDLHIPVKLPITLLCDNKAAQHLTANPYFHERSKHLDMDCHFTGEKI
ncbi:putative mitochondrial protein, partial [Tanacetum coccineum]